MTDHGHRRMRFDPYPLATIHRQPPPCHHDFDLEWLKPVGPSLVEEFRAELGRLYASIPEEMRGSLFWRDR